MFNNNINQYILKLKNYFKIFCINNNYLYSNQQQNKTYNFTCVVMVMK